MGPVKGAIFSFGPAAPATALASRMVSLSRGSAS